MQSMIEEIYHGRIKPEIKMHIQSAEYMEAMKTVAANEDLMGKLLAEREKELLSDLMDSQTEILNITAQEYFIEGFRIGARLGIDIMRKQDVCPSIAQE